MSKSEADILNDLIAHTYDAQDFYQTAIEETDDTGLRTLFTKMKDARTPIIADLSSRVMACGETPVEDSSVLGEAKSLFGQLRAKLSTDKDTTLVSELEEVEDQSLELFYSAIGNNLSEQTIIMLKRHANKIRETHNRMKTTKDMMKNAA